MEGLQHRILAVHPHDRAERCDPADPAAHRLEHTQRHGRLTALRSDRGDHERLGHTSRLTGRDKLTQDDQFAFSGTPSPGHTRPAAATPGD